MGGPWLLGVVLLHAGRIRCIRAGWASQEEQETFLHGFPSAQLLFLLTNYHGKYLIIRKEAACTLVHPKVTHKFQRKATILLINTFYKNPVMKEFSSTS